MELIEILQKWSGLFVAICAAIYAIVKYIISWCHIDVKDMDYKEKKIYLFKA